jgi:hypothetical protein
MDLHLFSKLDPEPDPHSLKKLDPDPHKVNADPKHCYGCTVYPAFFKSGIWPVTGFDLPDIPRIPDTEKAGYPANWKI